jgi:DNA-binding CsgD family transcriptional regulator
MGPLAESFGIRQGIKYRGAITGRVHDGVLHTEEVARRIGLSAETVKSDTKRAILKLEADTRVHAVAIALRQAIIE